jgi:hypothetical protein
MRFTSEVSFDLRGDRRAAASYIPFVRTLIKVVENVFTTKGLGASEVFTFRREIAPGVEVSIFYGAPYPSVTITAAPGGGGKQEAIEYLVRPLWEPEGFLVSYPGADVSLFVKSISRIHYHANYKSYRHTAYALPGIVPFPPCAIINRYRNNKYGDKLVKGGKILSLLDKPYLVSWIPLIHAEYTEEDKLDGPGIYRLVKSTTPEGTIISRPVRLLSDKYSLPKEEETDTWFLHEPEIYTPPIHSFQVLLDLINELRQQVGTAENDPDKARLLSFPFRGHGDLAYVICDEIVRSDVFSHDPGYRDPYKNTLSRSFTDLTIFPVYDSIILGENIASAPGSIESDNSARTVFEGWKASPGHFRVMTWGDYAVNQYKGSQIVSNFDYNLGQGPRYNPAAHIFGRLEGSSETAGSGLHEVSGDGSGIEDVSEGEGVSGHVWALDIRAQHSFAVAGDLITWEDAEGSERVTMRSYAHTVFFDPNILWYHLTDGIESPSGDWIIAPRRIEDLYSVYSSFFYKGRAIPVPVHAIFDYFRRIPYILLGVGRRKTGPNPGFYAVIISRDDYYGVPYYKFVYKARYFLFYLPEHADPWNGWRQVATFYSPVDDFVEGVTNVYFNASCTKFVFGLRKFDYELSSAYGIRITSYTHYWFECDFTGASPLVTLLSQENPYGGVSSFYRDTSIDRPDLLSLAASIHDSVIQQYAPWYYGGPTPVEAYYTPSGQSALALNSYRSEYYFNGTVTVRYGYVGDNLVYSYLRINDFRRIKHISGPPLGWSYIYNDYEPPDDWYTFISYTVEDASYSWVLYPAIGSSITLTDYVYHYADAAGGFSTETGHSDGVVVEYNESGYMSYFKYTNYLHGPTFIRREYRPVLGLEFFYFDGTNGIESVWSMSTGRSERALYNFTSFPFLSDDSTDTGNGMDAFTQICLKYKNEHFSALWTKPYTYYDVSVPPLTIVRSSLPLSLIAGRFPIGII